MWRLLCGLTLLFPPLRIKERERLIGSMMLLALVLANTAFVHPVLILSTGSPEAIDAALEAVNRANREILEQGRAAEREKDDPQRKAELQNALDELERLLPEQVKAAKVPVPAFYWSHLIPAYAHRLSKRILRMPEHRRILPTRTNV